MEMRDLDFLGGLEGMDGGGSLGDGKGQDQYGLYMVGLFVESGKEKISPTDKQKKIK